MNKKILLAFLLCLTMLFPGCSKKNQINTKLEINGYPDAKEFITGYPYSDDNPFGEYYSTFRSIKENENAVKTRYIDIGDKTFELNYKNSDTIYYSPLDVYTLKDNEDIEVYYHKDTDIVYMFYSLEGSLSEIFSYGEFAMNTEESLKAYSESIAKLGGFDLSGLEYTASTSGYEKDGTHFAANEYIKSEYNEKYIDNRRCNWKKVYSNGESLTSFSVLFSYKGGNFRVVKIMFESLPDEIFTLSDEEAIKIVIKDSSNCRNIDAGYDIVCNKLCMSVSYEYVVTYENGLVGTHPYIVYVFPADTTFP